MRKKIISTSAITMALSVLLSCSNNEFKDSIETNIVTFGGSISRVTGNAFDQGDEISVVAFDSDGILFGDAATYIYSDGSFSSESPIILPEGNSLSYFASYIAQEGIEESFLFTIQPDQNSEAGYEKSDLLIATVAESSSTSPILQFSHTMSNLEITINVVKDGVAVTELEVSEICFSALNNALCDIATSSYIGEGEVAQITPAQITENIKYAMILAPQTIAASSTFATLTFDETSYTWCPNSNITFGSGLKYEYTWTIDLTLKTSEITFTGDIADWGSGTIIDDEEIEVGENEDNEGDEGDMLGDENNDSPTTITLTSENFATTTSESTFVSNDIEFCTNFYSYNGAIYGSSNSYIYNTTAIEELKSVVIKYTTYTAGGIPFTLYLGDSANPSSGGDYSRSIDGNTYTYTINSGSFVSIAVANSIGIEYFELTYGSSN